MHSMAPPIVLGMALATHFLATPSPAQEAAIPVVRFHVEAAAELLQTAYPDRYGLGGSALGEDLEWAREHADRVTDRWRGWGPLYLQRLEAMREPSPFEDQDLSKALGRRATAKDLHSAFSWPGTV